MTPNPILKVLSTLKRRRVKCLLIGGQACIIYGAAEFSRDSDFAILTTPGNIRRLQKALDDLQAKLIYVPPLEVDYLNRGHACHFRCGTKDVKGLRIDIIARLRGCQSFDKLWERRSRFKLKDASVIIIISLQDLVKSKKTQRDKDWLMLKRLVENDIISNKFKHSAARVRWWFQECRGADLLIELAEKYRRIAKECAERRTLLASAVRADMKRLNIRLREEETIERQKDIAYWKPLRKELELLRRKKK